MKKCILFDLDGTLTDSGAGIIHCGQKIMAHYGLPAQEESQLRWLVGPPLRVSFPKLGVPEDKIEEAIELYRDFYTNTGIYENVPYRGIAALLQKLKADGHRLFIATSKPEYMAIDVLQRFNLLQYFELVCGCQRDGVRDKKSEVIAFLLNIIGSDATAVMVGDTTFDVVGASEHHVPTIGVTWGYGDVQEMQSCGAVAMADTVDELYSLLSQ